MDSETNTDTILAGHESRASNVIDCEYGPAVSLTPIVNTAVARIIWFKKKQFARTVSDKIRSLNNPNYSVPAVYAIQSSGNFIYQKSPGAHLTKEHYDSLDADDKKRIIVGLANFMNDMHQSAAVYPPEALPPIDPAKNMMAVLRSMISNSDFKSVSKLYDRIDSLNKGSHVFCHRDLKSENVLYDKKTKTLSIIDFSESEYRSLYDDFYEDDPDMQNLLPDLGISEQVLSVYKKLSRQKAVNMNFSDKYILQAYNYFYTLHTLIEVSPVCKKSNNEQVRNIVKQLKRLHYDKGASALKMEAVPDKTFYRYFENCK